ncbi:hypothetical protein SeMB42_g02640 [Synchytrium endobioticum]|nr:hypothetical protein SeMB42_g02640 [Synchytrium endobioticum]
MLASLLQTWKSWGDASQGTLKRRAHNLGQRLLDRIPMEETFLTHIPSLRGHHAGALGKVEVSVTADVPLDTARQKLQQLVATGAKVHDRYYLGALALIPLTLSLSILPGPNLPLAYNLYRAYCNYKAKAGAATLTQFFNVDSFSFVSRHPQLGIKYKSEILLSEEQAGAVARTVSDQVDDPVRLENELHRAIANTRRTELRKSNESGSTGRNI